MNTDCFSYYPLFHLVVIVTVVVVTVVIVTVVVVTVMIENKRLNYFP
jgi:hypothetical protein